MIPKTIIDRLLYFFDEIFPGIRDRFVIKENLHTKCYNFTVYARSSSLDWTEVLQAEIRMTLLANRLLDTFRMVGSYLQRTNSPINMNYLWCGYLIKV